MEDLKNCCCNCENCGRCAEGSCKHSCEHKAEGKVGDVSAICELNGIHALAELTFRSVIDYWIGCDNSAAEIFDDQFADISDSILEKNLEKAMGRIYYFVLIADKQLAEVVNLLVNRDILYKQYFVMCFMASMSIEMLFERKLEDEE